ncbi:MAG: DUF5606 domain-containing protein [Lascolabacillus sp.]|uniref:DUF5606 family protein n=1 Tax=Lascolabacillus sp. TaxID=1924068 RepID=UPI002584A9C9|nr:DUF5606 domain-containing protein [Lascolabacillus sp.]MDD4757601.1 DUF5606 domain-containing protein [Lascolabacillus sp.]
MLTKILSITGRPGLYKLISTNQNMNIVESLIDGKRIPVYMHEKIVALSDVSMYTNDGDIPLKEVLKKIKEKENSKPVLLNSKSSSKELFSFLIEVLPEYNKESVYASDVKKLISWYNILIEKGIDFETEESKTEENELEEHAENESEL